MASVDHKDLYDELGSRYEQFYGHDPGLLELVQKALDIIPSDASVLDVGCGTGKPVSSMLANSGRRVLGLDFSQTMVELSRKNVPQATFEQADMLKYVPDTPFTAAFAIFSLFRVTVDEMHIVNSRWPSWVAVGGHLFIGTMLADDFPTTPDMFDTEELYAQGIPRKFMGDQRGTLLFTRKGWKKMLEDAGFEILFSFTKEFQAPEEAECDVEPHHYIGACRIR